MRNKESDIMTNDKKRMVDSFETRLVDAYGYSKGQIGRNVHINDCAAADIAIWRTEKSRQFNSIPDICVVVICKDEHIKIDANRYLDEFKKSDAGSINFYVLHNLKETKVFLLDSSHPMGGIERIGDFPKANEILTEESIVAFISRMRRNTKDALVKAFERCHNIVRNNDKLSPEAAFDEISKVMFIKMLYERTPDGELLYSREKFLLDEKSYLKKLPNGDYIGHLFEEVKSFFVDDDLYERHDRIRICRNSFEAILKELEVIDLYDMSEDVKGVAYESLVGKTFRGELGQFFTPRQVVNYIIDVLDIKEGEKVCDPCCGSGGFLIRAFEYVQDSIDRDIQRRIETVKCSRCLASEKRRKISALLQDCDKGRQDSRYAKLCRECFFGVDANVRMARTSKMNMIMHGDGHVGVYLHDGLLNVKNVHDDQFDVVVINPPYGVHVDRSMRDENGKLVFGQYATQQSAAELMFVERVINLLKPGGRAGLVLPEGMFTNSNLRNFRKHIEERADILNITAMPPTVFLAAGANIKPNILFIRKKAIDQANGVAEISVASTNETGLSEIVKQVRGWVGCKERDNTVAFQVVRREEMVDWSVAPFFSGARVRFNEKYAQVALSQLISQSTEKTDIEDNVKYNRITVKLFGKGISLRDCVLGRDIGVKRQYVVRSGQLVVSKIDGKSGAMGIIQEEFAGAIVTQDFPVFNIDTTKVLPEYLISILVHPAILEKIASTSSGSTGRRRLSIPRFLAMKIALPSISEQKRLLRNILHLKEKEKEIQRTIEQNVRQFYSSIIEE